MGDELKLREVLQNLITNGLEYAAKKGTVLVEGEVLHRPDGPVVKVVVQDDGPGMPDEQMHLVFHHYSQRPGRTGRCTSCSTAPATAPAGPGWAWPSARSSSSSTAARSGPSARQTAAAPS